MVNATEARRIILDSLSPMPTESCELHRSYGRILAETVVAPHDVPAFDNSGMDGYAVRSRDVSGAGAATPVSLVLRGEVPAGNPFTEKLEERSAVRIMTGAPVPPGADAVVEQELTEGRNGTVVVLSPVQAGRNIRPRGDDIRKGDEVCAKGAMLTSARVGILASLGKTPVQVYQTPTVAVLTTGNELVGVDSITGPGQIRNSNAFTLGGLLRECGCAVLDLGIARDDPAELRAAIREGLRTDALITSGGVSVGKHDHVLGALEAEGVVLKFRNVNIKPGKPFAYGLFENSKPVFALPGNPVSTFVTFLQFVRSGLETLKGRTDYAPVCVTAVLGESIRKQDGKRHFVRGIMTREGNRMVVRTTGTQNSGVLSSLAKANCLIVIPEEVRSLDPGDSVEIELL